MFFFINSRMSQGATRDQIVEHFSQDFDPKAWELVKKGILSQWYYKIGDEPGIIDLIHSDSTEEARTISDDTPAVKEGLLEFDIEPVNHFPNFD